MFLTDLQCPRCHTRHDANRPQNLCSCGSPLLARYDLDAVRKAVTPQEISTRAADLWRYRELLPLQDDSFRTTLGEGWTLMWRADRFGAHIGLSNLLVKDEGLIPTGSFKARGAAVGVSRARELGISHIAMPTNGNAGAAWATYAARAGIKATIAMPRAAPTITRQEVLAAGGELHLVDGVISDAGRLIGTLLAQRPEIFDASTLKEPYRLEGKKTMGYEIAEQLGWRVPDVIIYPTGGGVGLIGIHKALTELRQLGWIDPQRTTRLVAVQSTGCAPIVRAFATGQDRAQPWPDAYTVAFGINVPSPLGDRLILEAIQNSGGTAISVDDSEILADLRNFAAREGLLLCPEGAACLTAARKLRAKGWLSGTDEVVVLNTGAGIKYPGTVQLTAD